MGWLIVLGMEFVKMSWVVAIIGRPSGELLGIPVRALHELHSSWLWIRGQVYVCSRRIEQISSPDAAIAIKHMCLRLYVA